MATLTTGERAPDFKLSDQGGNIVSLKDFKGKKMRVLLGTLKNDYKRI